MSTDLKHRLGGVALHVVSVDDDLDDAVPDLIADVVPGDTDEVEDGVDVPGVVHGVLLRQDGHFEDLREGERRHCLRTRERHGDTGQRASGVADGPTISSRME